MHDVAGEIACAEGCAETISANVLKVLFLLKRARDFYRVVVDEGVARVIYHA